MITISRIHRAMAVLPLAFLLASTSALAGPDCAAIFSSVYPGSQTEDLAGCQTCHQSTFGGNTFNVYGIDLRANGAQGAGFSCANGDFAAALVAVQGLDSDGEGNSNLDEINASTQPGWCDPTQSETCTNSAGTAPDVALDPAAPPPAGNNPPVADAGGPYTGEAGTTLVQFDGRGSTDADNDPLTYAWDFGDMTTGSGAQPTHTYTNAGDFTVTLVVNDGFVDSAPGTASATISAPPMNLPPVAVPGGPYDGQPGQPVVFDGSASSDPNGDTLAYTWDFGDSSFGDGVAPSHTYATVGTFTVTLTVNDGAVDSDPATTSVTISEPLEQSGGEALYVASCQGCHGDPWAEPPVDHALAGLRRVAGARSCNIQGSIFGTSVFPNGVPEMQFLQGISDAEIDLLAEYLNSRAASGEQRYVTTCAGCHGDDASGGRVGEDVYGDSAHETWEAINEEDEMHYLACMPESDIQSITEFLQGFDDDFDDDGIADDEDSDDDNDGVSDEDEHEDGTDPRDHDCDDDGLDDGEEREHGTDPLDEDTDDDGVSDGDEVKVFGTDPLLASSVPGANNSGGGSTGLPALLLLLALVAVRLRRKRTHECRH